MKKRFISILLITCSIFFTGCSVISNSKETAPNLIKQDTKETLIVTGEVNKTYHNDKDVKIARDAIYSAERIPGILNVPKNNLEMTLIDTNGDKENYLLWLLKGDNNGMIMNVKDTHTGYTLQKEDVVKLKKLLNF